MCPHISFLSVYVMSPRGSRSMEKVFGEGVRLQREGILQKVDADSTFYFARLNKLWFADLDGNAWEIFTVHEQLA